MPRRRRYYRRSYYSFSKKYSNETFGFHVRLTNPASSQQVYTAFVPSVEVLGTRKTKNYTLNLISSNENLLYQFALIYLPQGTLPSQLQLGATTDPSTGVLISQSIYEPNQNVVLSGFGGGPNGTAIKVRTKLARNLNSGDGLILVIRPMNDVTGTVDLAGQLNYAVSYQ